VGDSSDVFQSLIIFVEHRERGDSMQRPPRDRTSVVQKLSLIR